MAMEANFTRIDWDFERLSLRKPRRSLEHRRCVFSSGIFENHRRIWVEIGAGTGKFFTGLSKIYHDVFFIPIERDRHRSKRLLQRALRGPRANLHAVRGNAISALIHEILHESIERIYILYPCPYPKTSQRKNRWYLHPLMGQLVRILKPGGLLIWASDQKFYIEEARYVCEKKFSLKTLGCGVIRANTYNDLENFPAGRTKFEQVFFQNEVPCFELIARK